MIAAKLQRADLLHEHRRYDEALAVLAEVLMIDPDCASAHFQKTWNLLELSGKKPEALDAIDTAVSLDPEEPVYRATRSLVLSRLRREKEAIVAAESAIAQNPELGLGWMAKAEALVGQGKWEEAEGAIRTALAIDPDDIGAANLLAHVLRMQNRLDVSSDEVGKRLAKDAEDPFSHANAGWVALQKGDRAQAEEHFREALRLDSESEYARSGLLESYKARSLFYRLYLKWVFFIQKYSERNQWIIAIGIYLAFRFARGFLSAVHPLLGAAVAVVYVLFVFGSWIASGIGHFIILKDPLARLTLNGDEKKDAWAVGGMFMCGLVMVLCGVTFLPLFVAVAGATLLASTIPASRIFLNYSKWGKVVFSSITVVIYCCAVSILTTGDYMPAGLALLLSFGSTWLSLIRGLYQSVD